MSSPPRRPSVTWMASAAFWRTSATKSTTRLPASDGMDMLRTLASALGQYDPEAGDNSAQANQRKAIRVTAQMGSIVATYGRMQAGGGPGAPPPAPRHRGGN